MSNKIYRIEVKLYEEVTETHDIEVTKEQYDRIKSGEETFEPYEHITDDTLTDKEYGNNTDYEYECYEYDRGVKIDEDFKRLIDDQHRQGGEDDFDCMEGADED